MNLFEKIFNYQILSRLEDSGTSIFTNQERAWLKTMLEKPISKDALSPSTRDKLMRLLARDETYMFEPALIEKARSKDKPLFHPHLQPLRLFIQQQSGLKLTTKQKNGQIKEREPAFPFKLEYSMVKREWYLIWYHLRYKSLFSTKLENIVQVEPHSLTVERIRYIQEEILQRLEQRKRTVTIEVIPQFNQELSRILYAFSCFEKDVDYNEETDKYRIRLTYQSDEGEFVLSRLRFLGRRVQVVENDYLRKRMLESATKALARYDVEGCGQPKL